jgi:hypothetical protein
MLVERREGVTRIEIEGQRETGGARGFRWEAAAFGGWHEPYEARASRTVVCPGKASMFSRRQTCRGRSQSPVVRIAEVMETETLKPIDKVSLGEATSHRAVTTVNALWPRK